MRVNSVGDKITREFAAWRLFLVAVRLCKELGANITGPEEATLLVVPIGKALRVTEGLIELVPPEMESTTIEMT